MEKLPPKAPLWISPLYQKESSSENGSYRTVKKLVTCTPNPDTFHGEVETCLEEYIGSTGKVLWRRVAVRGCIGADRVLHASFKLPEDDGSIISSAADNDGNSTIINDEIMCWTSFPERPNHKLLCVLANPLLLCIWDVYPTSGDNYASESIGGGEGNSLTLPFEARGIFPLEDNNGILLQRKQSLEDRILQNELKWRGEGGFDDDADFVLHDPPAPVRLGTMLASPSGMEMTIPQPSPQHSAATFMFAVPSLFSLKHPLDEILPLAMLERDGSQSSSPPDVLEQVLFVGALRWVENDCNSFGTVEHSQQICVTYHNQRKRHAVWLVDRAPPPPPNPPLWQVSRTQREENGGVDNDMGALHELPMDGRLGATDADMSWHGTTNRNEALADALGVTNARRSEDPKTNRGRIVGERSRRSGGLKKPQPQPSLFSPTATTTAANYTPMNSSGSEPRKAGPLAPDASGATPEGKGAGIAESPFADLSPDLALTPLFEEEPNSADFPAESVFLTSNIDSSGLLELCLVCPSQASSNPFELRRLRFAVTRQPKDSESHSHVFSVGESTRVPCMSAQPVQSIPAPLCFIPGAARKMGAEEACATDVLVLSRDGLVGASRLALCRSDIVLADCALSDFLDPNSATSDAVASIVELKHPVADNVDFVCSNDDGTTYSVRGKLSLRFPASPISNAALAASDAAFFFPDDGETRMKKIETALQLRVDSVKLAQAMRRLHTFGQQCEEDASWSAVECVFSAFIESFIVDRSSKPRMPAASEKSSFVDSDWQALLNSDFGHAYKDGAGSSLFLGLDECDNSNAFVDRAVCLFDVMSKAIQPTWLESKSRPETPSLAFHVFDSMNLLYEEARLSLCRSWQNKIGSLLAQVCFRSGFAFGDIQRSENILADFLDHYRRDLGSKWLEHEEKTSRMSCEVLPVSSGTTSQYRQILTSFTAPPSFLDWVDSIMKVSAGSNDFTNQNFYRSCQSERIPVVYRNTRAMHRVFSALYGGSETDQSIRDETVVQILIEEGMADASALRDELPSGLVVPLMEVLHRCRENPYICTAALLSSDACSLVGRTDMRMQRGQQEAQTTHGIPVESLPAHGQQYQDLLADEDRDGILPLEVTSSVLFPDNRIHEVGKLLRSSRPVYLVVPRAPEVSDHDYERLKQERLLILCRRTFAIPLGRGMLTLGNLKPIPADPLPVPLLCLSGRVPPTNTSLALDTSSTPSDMTVWPEFHNAVAAGLRLPFNDDTSEETLRQITRSWIVYNGGSSQSSTQQNQQNSESNEGQSQVSHAQGGLLMALGFRGHLSTLKMTDIYDYLTDGVVTTTVGVLLGMASNKRGSCDPAVSKMLCLHIPSLLPASFTGIDVASPAQAAAITGIGLLYQGSSNRMMTEFLLEEMGKRPTNDSIMADREAYTLSCGLALGMVNLAKGKSSSGVFDGVGWNGLADLDIGERLHRLIVGGVDHPEQQKRRKEASERFSNLPSTETEHCYSIFEGDNVNTDVTAPGATLALGLMYMKSGNHAVASSMALPDTHFLLDYIRPDMLLLRVVSRSLILWDEVEPTSTWIEAQVPAVILESYRQMRSTVERISGMSDSDEPDPSSTGRNMINDESVDKQAVRQIYVHVIAGACFGIGLRYAGTGDERAASAVAERLAELKALREAIDPVSAALRPDLQILEMCIASIATSLAMIMAGTGDLETFRLLRSIRWRCDDDIRYGSHMAYGAAIGLLFLGGGSYTLGRSDEDLAALLMAFFPRLPSTSSDNQHHLQALRHCYALAVEKREVRAVDSETGTVVSVPIEIDFAEESIPSKEFTAPCLLLNTNGTPKTLRVSSDRYYPLSIDITKTSSRNIGTTFYVKRRSGRHGHDASDSNSSQHSLIVQANTGSDSVEKMVELFTEDPTMIAYSRYLCKAPFLSKGRLTSPNVLVRVLHECLVNNTKEALPLYLKLTSSVGKMSSDDPSSVDAVWDVRLIQSYYKARSKNAAIKSTTRIISAEFVSILQELVRQVLAGTPLDENDVLVYMKTGEVRRQQSALGLLGSFLTFYETPFPRKSDDTMEL